MVAAITPLPVVGVPVKSSALSGNDSLLSIVQMPKGVPVATVAIGNAANAGECGHASTSFSPSCPLTLLPSRLALSPACFVATRPLPVTTDARRAGLLAVRMLGCEDLELRRKMQEFMRRQETEARATPAPCRPLCGGCVAARYGEFA